MKKQKFCTLFVLLISCLTLCNCGHSNKEKIILESKRTFTEAKWNRFKQFINEVEITDTSANYAIILEAVVTPDIVTDNIPIVFSIYSPDGGESHTRSTIYLNPQTEFNNAEIPAGDRVIQHKVYASRSFYASGKYKFKYYQKYPKYDLEGIKSITLRIKTVTEE